ncbi:MAG: cytochrome P450 [Pseudomonadota bacterium]
MRLSDDMIDALDLRNSFVPAFPARRSKKGRSKGLHVLQLMRRNLLAVFDHDAFSSRKMGIKVLSRDIAICNNPDGVRQTLTAQHETFECKTPQQRFSLAPLLGDGLFVSDGETWRERRAIVTPIVHARHMASFAPIMCETIAEWCEEWRAAGPGTRLDILFEMGELTAEIICRTIFGKRLGRQYTREIIAGFAQYQRHADAVDLPSLMGASDTVPRKLDKKAKHAIDRVHHVLDKIVDEIAERGPDREGEEDGAIIRALFNAKGRDGKQLSREAVRNEAIVIFMAGHETTANTLAFAIYLVAQSERVREKLMSEFEEVLGGRLPELSDVPKLNYTRAVIEETLRLYPPVPILGREAKAHGTLNGAALEPGTLLLVAPWLIHRNRDVWSLPDHFVPERFDRRYDNLRDKYAYIPFASGPRVCPGLTFAMTEAVLCLSALLQEFHVRPLPRHRMKVECRLTLRPGNTLPMVVTPRDAVAGKPGKSLAPLRQADIPWEATEAPRKVAPPLRDLFSKMAERSAPARRYHIGDRVRTAADAIALNTLSALPIDTASACGARLGTLVSRQAVQQKTAERIRERVKAMLSDASDADVERICAAWWRNAGRNRAEYAISKRLYDAGRLSVVGTEHLDAAFTQGRPIILGLVHTGHWELIPPLLMGRWPGDWTGLWQPQASDYRNRVVERARRRVGAKAFPNASAMSRSVLRLLNTPGQNIVTFLDAEREGRSLFPLLGREPSPLGAFGFTAKIALKTGALILPGAIVRLGESASFRLELAAPVDGLHFAGDDPVRSAAERLNPFFEAHVKRYADQWYMLPFVR